MATQSLACPSCGSAVAEPSVETGDVLTCPYCESRYRVLDHRAVGVTPAALGDDPPSGRQLAVAMAALAGIIGLSVLAARGLQEEESPPPVMPELDLEPFDVAEVLGPEAVETERVAPKPMSQPLSDAAKEALAPPSAEWRINGVDPGRDGTFWLLGHIENTSPYTLDHPKVVVVLLDEDGADVGTDFGYPTRTQLAPGEVSPARILVNTPPPHDSYRVELELKQASFLIEQVEGLRVEAMEPKHDPTWGWSFQGRVHHEGTVPAQFVKVEVQILDSEGGLVGLGTTYAGGDLMLPGSSAVFQTTHVDTIGEPASFSYTVSGRPE